MRYVCSAVTALIAVLTFSPSSPLQAAVTGAGVSGSGLSIDGNYTFVSQAQATRTQWWVTYRAELQNQGGALPGVTATVTSLVPSVTIVPGQNSIHFSSVPASGTATSSSTFTILVDRTQPFSFANLQWTFNSPFANAGPDQTVPPETTVLLDGGGSSNPDGGGQLTFSWAFASKPPGSSASIANPNSVTPSFVPDLAGQYVVTLTVSNGASSNSDNVTISSSNSAPVADAGPNQTVAVGSNVNLNGTGSSDIDGNALTYEWFLISIPSGSRASLGSTYSSVTPSFSADVAGTYIAELVVNDGQVSSAPATVTITTGSTPPVANAGPNQVVSAGALVQLNGFRSTDVNGKMLTYKWSLVAVPSGSAASLSDPSAVNPTFTADVSGTYIAQLVVNDGSTDSAPSTALITTNATLPPVANAGPDQVIIAGTTVTLSGSGTDPQNLPLTYQWALLERPSGSIAKLLGANTMRPSLTADVPGTYVAQLVVNNGKVNSAPSTVVLSTGNVMPVAVPGSAQNVAAGTLVTLNGSGSYDTNSSPLTYSWALIHVPSGSSASLSDANSASPQFQADLPGVYVAQLIVNDGVSNSAPETVMVMASNLKVSLAPNPLNLSLNATGTLTVNLTQPAPSGGVVVSFSGFDPSVISLPPSITVLANATSASVTVTPLANGSTNVLATAPGYISGLAAVNVATPSISIALPSGVGIAHSVTGTITLSAPAPSTGTVVTVTSSATGFATVSLSPVTIASGGTTGTFTVTGVAVGSANITASAPSYTSGSASILVAQLGAIGLAPNVTVGPGQSAALNVSLSAPAPAGGETVTLSSGDTTKLTVTSSVFIAQGATTPATEPQVTGVAFGTVTVTATAPGYLTGTQTVQVAANLSFSPPSTTIGVGGTQTVALNLSNASPSAVTVSLGSSNTSVATVPTTVTILANATSASVLVTTKGAGSTTITASTTTPNIASGTLGVTVTSFGGITLPGSVPVGLGQTVSFPVTLSTNAPTGGVTVTLSSNSTNVSVSPSTVFIAGGQTTPSTQPTITGVGPGTASITASAPGFGSSASSVQVTASLSLAPTSPVNITAGASPTFTVTLSGAAPAGGLLVNLSTSTSGIVTVQSTVTIAANATSATFPVTGVAPGSTVLTASAAVANVSNATDTINVQAAGTIGIPAGVTVAPGQSTAFAVTLPSAAPQGGVTVTLSSSDTTKVTISPATVTITAGQTQPTTQPQVTGVNFGSANITASASGYTSGVQSVAVGAKLTLSPTPVTLTGPGTTNLTVTLSAASPSAVTVNLSSGTAGVVTIPASVTIAANATTATVPVTAAGVGTTILTASSTAANVSSGTASITVQSAGALGLPAGVSVPLGTSTAFNVTLPAAAPTGGVTVTLSSSDSNVSISPATVTILAGATTPTTQPTITGVAPGSATITASAPLYTSASQTVQTTATIALTPQNPSITATNSQTLTLTLSGPAPTGGITFAVSSSNTAVATVPTSTYTIAATAKTVSIPVTGVAAGTAVITASAANLTSATDTVTVTQNVGIIVPATLTVGPGSTVTFPVTLAAAPTSAITVTLAIGNSSLATLNFTSVSFNAGSTTPTREPTLTGVASGTTTITATSPGLASAQSQITVGSTATLTPSPLTLIAGGSGTLTLSLSTAVTSTTTFTLSSTNSAIASPSRSQIQFSAGAQSESFTVTAGSTLGSATITASATGFGTASATVNVNGVLGISTTSPLPNGTVGVAYSATIAATGGIPPYTFSATGLPANLTINSSTGQITGTPAAAGTSSNVVIKVTDSNTPTANTSQATFSLTINKATPASITATSGTPQSAQIGVAFSAPLVATVKDSGGNPVSGAVVTFTAPASGASGSFAGGVNTATTNASGVATSAVFTANNTLGSYSVNATVTGVTTPAVFALTNLTGPAASITTTSGTPQTASVGTAFAAPLVATVKDAGGNPVSGVVVTFTVPASGASGSFAGGVNTATTNASGVATSATFTANSSTGTYNVTASVSGVTTPATFVLTNSTGAAASITATAGTPQSAAVNTAFASTLAATVKDNGGNPVSGVTVTFTAPASGASGSFAGGSKTATATTSASGVATSPVFTANGTTGTYNVTATTASLSANFALTNTVGAAASITATSGTPQTAEPNAAFAAPLVATVKDSGGNVLSGVVVTFTAPASGASGTFAGGGATATAMTNTSGVATSPTFTANSSTGTYTLTATVAGVATPANFVLTNQVGAAASITATSGTPQSAAVNTAFASTLAATVKDSGGNPVSGATVTFTAPASGASGTFAGGLKTAAATTSASGIATSPVFTANATTGSYNVTATTASLSANFALTNTLGAAASITATSGTPQTAEPNAAFAAPLVATVKDSGGNVLSGVVVTFKAPASGASGTFAGGVNTATTNASGVATSAIFTANSSTGTYTVTATVSGVATPANFSLTNQVGAAASMTATGGTPQSAQIKTAFSSALSATVKDSAGNLVSGVTVTFTAPSSGQSGLFANGTTTTTATTSTSGVATSSTFTANASIGTYNVSATVSGVATPATFALTNTSGPAGSITVTSGNNQTVTVNTAFAALSVTVKDSGNNPVSGATVTFTAPTSGASGSFAGGVTTAVTNASGVATAPVFTANSKAGSYVVSAITSGVATPAIFNLTNQAGAVASLVVVSGSGQSAATNTAFASPLKVMAEDAGGNPVSGVTVTFTPPASGAGGSFAGNANTAVTDSTGTATSVVFTANGTVGPYTVTASAGSFTAPFSLTNLAGAPASVTVTGGSGQSAVINTAFTSPFVVVVKDAGGNVVPNTSVTFSVPSSGASGTFTGGAITATATTNASGSATSPVFTANSTAGTYVVTAKAGTASATLSETNTAGPAASISVKTGSSQAATILTAFATPFSVSVLDSGSNPVGGVNVTFTAPSSGASGTFAGGGATAVVATNSSGVATAPAFTANHIAGSYAVTAAVSAGITTTINNVTNNPGNPAAITVVSGSGQSANLNAAFGSPLQAEVTDAGGNALRGISVTFTAPNSGASGLFAGGTNTSTVTTIGTGIATSAVFTANGTSGNYNVVASTAGVTPSANFALQNNNVCTGCGNITVSSATIGFDLETTLNIVFSPALPAGSTLTISSSSPNALIGNAGIQGKQSITLTGNPSPESSISTTVQAFASSGAATISVSVTGYQTGIGTITFGPSGFVIDGGSGIGNPISVYQGAVAPLTVEAELLNASTGAPVANQDVAGGVTVSVPVNNSNSSAGAVSPTSASFTGGNATATVNFTGSDSGTGSTNLSVSQPSGFTAPSSGTSVTATLQQTSFAPFSATIGQGLAQAQTITLSGPAGNALPLTITSSNGAALKFATSPTDPNSVATSITVTVAPNHSVSPTFYVVGVGSTGNIGYTISSPGYTTVNGTVTLAPAALGVQFPYPTGGFNGSFTASVSSGASPLGIYTGYFSGGNFVPASPAPGSTVTVNVVSGTPGVGTVSPSSVSIASGSTNGSVTLTPVGQGTTQVTASATGFTSGSVNATYTTQQLNLFLQCNDTTIGFDLETACTVYLPPGAPDQVVNVSSNSGSILLSSAAGTVGTATLSLSVAANPGSATFYVQSTGTTGSPTVTVSSAGDTSASVTETLAPSGIVFAQPEVDGSPNSTSSVGFTATPLDSSGNPIFGDSVGPNGLTFDMTSGNASVAAVPATVTIPVGNPNGSATVTLGVAGSTTISISQQPAGFGTPIAADTTVPVSVQ